MKLASPVTSLPLVGPVFAKRLEKLEIFTLEDLLLHVPFRYLDFRNTSSISDLKEGEIVTVSGTIVSLRNIYTRYGKKIQIGKLADKGDKIDVVWFNQPFLIKNIPEGSKVSLAGKVGFFSGRLAMISPEYELFSGGKGVHTGRLIPVYHETSGISSKWFRQKIAFTFPLIQKEFTEFLSEDLLKKEKFTDLSSAVKFVHFPQSLLEAQKGKERLAFNELLFAQLTSAIRKREWQKNEASYSLKLNRKEINSFVASLPFSLTSSQESALNEILKDLTEKVPMNRILEGDVGSGKTVVAAIAAFVAFSNGYQSVIMAPTQILAQQHYETVQKLFSAYKVRVTLITSEGISSDIGKTDIFVGTHSLIHRKVDFDKVGLVVIDEQHRFGVEQRAHLIKKVGKRRISPHLLTMTATPIPRTVALTVYGDLDLSTLKELPKGRKKIATWIVPSSKKKGAYSWLQEKILKDKVQAFVICPLIEESSIETMTQVKAATKEYENLKEVLPKLKLGLLHGKMSLKEKNTVIKDFFENRIQVLIATPVVEVGIDIPNAVVMVIEGAERFGLAQLHQLRGRVGRSDKKSYCLIFSDAKSGKAEARLSALTKTMSGFELAELDLKLRGPGELFGLRQHGFLSLKIASWQDFALIKKARDIATSISNDSSEFSRLEKMLELKGVVPN